MLVIVISKFSDPSPELQEQRQIHIYRFIKRDEWGTREQARWTAAVLSCGPVTFIKYEPQK